MIFQLQRLGYLPKVMMMKNSLHIIYIFLLLSTFSCTSNGDQFESTWNMSGQQTWTGPDFWSNPLQDWKINAGRLECMVTKPNRSVHLITWMLSENSDQFRMQTDIGFIDPDFVSQAKGWGGFLIGATGEFDDYRDNAVYGKGIHAGITTTGQLFIGDSTQSVDTDKESSVMTNLAEKGITLKIKTGKVTTDEIQLILNVFEKDTRQKLSEFSAMVEKEMVAGNIALKADLQQENADDTRTPSLWFDNWKADGSKLVHYPERKFGPVLFTQYTRSKGITKITAQFPWVNINLRKPILNSLTNPAVGKQLESKPSTPCRLQQLLRWM